LAIARLNLTGRVALHDGATSRGTLELSDIAIQLGGSSARLSGAISAANGNSCDGIAPVWV